MSPRGHVKNKKDERCSNESRRVVEGLGVRISQGVI